MTVPFRFMPPYSRARVEAMAGHPLSALVQPYAGLIEGVRFLPLALGEPEIEVATAMLGDITMAKPDLAPGAGRGGAGTGSDPGIAWIRAVAEAAERYASMMFSDTEAVAATARELGAAAIDLRAIPRCSEAEYRDPKCPLSPASDTEAIRWVRGLSLADHKERFVPAVMTHLYVRSWKAERFWLQISTGVAAHTSLAAALVSAICEIIERDAIALTWLGRLPLSRIERSRPVSEEACAVFDIVDASGTQFLEFDATTDLGIPVVFAVQLAPGHPFCSLSVSCATSLDPEEAHLKAMREACSARLIMNKPHELPAEVIDFYKLSHGAHYYGLGGHEQDFEFLLAGTKPATTTAAMAVSGLPPVDGGDSARLAFLLARLREHGMEAIAIDLSTDECRDVGLWVVRVIIPQLMPISFVHRARYLGTPRLYEYVGRKRGCKFTEADVNPCPLPFA